ncbi:PAS domain S-box protein [Aeoliella sp.]|uniref:PAS domain S-box protein n=1 Tax=Aeoliella sp. TaxID=2795800 RepID=UPI003CCB79A0
MWLGWGPEFTFIYNDAYAKMTLGPKHPWALGQSAREVWSEIWEDIGPRADSVLKTGEATWDEGLLLFLERKGFPEETYHTFSYSPLPSDRGSVGGMLCVVTEETERAIGERRLQTLRELAARTTDETRSAEQACQSAAKIIADNPYDFPFAAIYLLEGDQDSVKLVGTTGFKGGFVGCPEHFQVNDTDALWPLKEVGNSGKVVDLDHLQSGLSALEVGIWPEPPRQAMVLPISKPGQAQVAGFLIAGVSPRLALDDSYRGFFDLVAGQLATTVANARAYEDERRRAEALAELDRAKTAFFSNVSHEFRTPLTLMLGPLADMLSEDKSTDTPIVREQLEVVNRNGLRLLRLVNSLLDFSRIEAGRAQASFVATDLSSMTAELASVFRAACERAEISLKVECDQLDELVFVDRDMWEKIVLNLLSNALKFTRQGEISVTLRKEADAAVLCVSDTGVGVAAEDLPRLFERFHRSERTWARTHEGSGIGLALVQELVNLHGGSVTAESDQGDGTAFTVVIPLGSSHLPPDQVTEGDRGGEIGAGAAPFVEEALRWLPDNGFIADVPQFHSCDSRSTVPSANAGIDPRDRRPRVLVADDNADMRDYVVRLLSDSYCVTAVADGDQALEAAYRDPPELVVADVMMPNRDGFSLLQALRENPALSDIPVVLLSARAGEESRIEGMEAGADDYLVKPFSARELLARVAARLQIASVRRESKEAVRESEERLRMALEAARMVAWRWDLSTDLITMSGNAPAVLGLQADRSVEKCSQFFSLIHPQDAARHRETLERTIEHGASYSSQFRIVRQNSGETLWLEERGQAVRGDNGEATCLIGIVIDVTDRKAMEDTLRDREQLLQAIFETTPECIKVVAPDGTLLQMNPAGVSMVEAEAIDAILGGCVYDLIAPECRDSFRQFNDRICSGGRGMLEFEIIGQEGTRRSMETHAVPLKGADGAQVQLAITRDVTTRKQAETALRREKDLLQVTLASIGDAVVTTDTQECVTSMNPVAESLTGWSSDDAVGLSLDQIIRVVSHDADGRVDGSKVPACALDSQERSTTNSALILSDGKSLPVDINRAAIRGDDGERIGSVLVIRDVTDRKRAEDALRESEVYFRTMADNAPAMLWVTEHDCSCSFLSRGWYEYTGQTEAEGLGDGGFGWLKAVHPEDRDDSARVFMDANAAREPFSLDYRLRRHDGEYRWAIDSGTPRFDTQGEFIGYIGTVIDVHERKQAEEFRAAQIRVLEMITSEQPLEAILTELVTYIESQVAGAIGSILLVDNDGKRLRHGAAPRLPKEYNEAIDGIEIGPNVGSCGTAAYHGRQILVDDIQSDPLWADFKDLAEEHGLSACWSEPIRSSTGELLGTTALYFTSRRTSRERELAALAAAARFAGIAIERPRAQAALRQSEQQLRAYTDATFDVVYRMSPDWSELRLLQGRGFLTDADSPSRSWLNDYVSSDDQPRITAAIAAAIESKTTFELEHRVICKDGSTGWIYSRAIPLLDAHNNITEWFGAASDVTQRKSAEEALRLREQIMAGQREALELAVNDASLEESLGVLVRSAIQALGGEVRAGFYLANDDRTSIRHIVGMSPEYAAAIDQFPIGPHSMACGLAIHMGEPIITPDVRNEPLWEPWLWLAKETGFYGCWSFPIHTTKEQYVGTMAVYTNQPRDATTRDKETCALLVHSASVIISRKTESDVRKQTQKALRESARLNAMLSQAGTQLLQDSNPQRVVEECCRDVLEFLDCQTFFNYIFDANANRLRLNACAGVPPDDAARIEWMDLGDAVCGCVARDCRRFSADDIGQSLDPRTELVKSYGIQAYCCHPLIVQGRLLGTLSFGTRSRKSFSDQDIDTMKSISDLVALAMDRIQSEQSLRDSQESFRRSAETFAALVEESPLGIYTVDSEFKIKHASAGSAPAFQNIQPVIGRDFAEVMHAIWPAEFADEAIRLFRRTLETGEPYISPGLTEQRKDLGTVESYEWQINRVTLADGGYGVVCYYFDTTRLQHALQNLRDSEERFRMLADNMAQLAWTCTELGEVNWYNQRWLDYTGRPSREMLGEGWVDVLHPDHLERVKGSVDRSRRSGVVWVDTIPLRRADGKYRWFLSRAVPIRDDSGAIIRWFGTNTDITEQRNAEEALKQADRRKDEFLATLAHELRNPLAPIRSGIDLLRLDTDPQTIEDTRLVMERQLSQLVALVDDLLDVSRITRGKFELRKRRVTLEEIVRSAVEATHPLVTESKHTLTVSLPEQAVHLDADPNRLAQIISNLLTNAARYTPPQGTIDLHCEVRQDQQVVVRIVDNGVGIPIERQGRVFDMFDQGDRSQDQGHGGLGIGLTLVKSLTEMHGGTVSVSSEGKGMGSEFKVMLPIVVEASTDHKQPSTELSASFGLRVLVVDDNRSGVYLLSALCQKLGNEVRTASDGHQAILAAEEFRPQVVLMDVNMPVMDGCAAARHIREQAWGEKMTLVAVTGNGQAEDRRRSQESGFDRHLVKPAGIDDLQELFSSISCVKRG